MSLEKEQQGVGPIPITTATATTITTTTIMEPSTLSLRIKSFKDVEIHVPLHSNVSSVKAQVRSALGTGEDRYLRLICKGRLLAPDAAQLREFSVQDGDVLHAVLAAAGVRGGQQAALSRASVVHNNTSSGNGANGTNGNGTSSRSSTTLAAAFSNISNNNNNNNNTSQRRHRGTIVGPGGRVLRANSNSGDDGSSSSDDEETGGNTGQQRQQQRMGFDRLRSSGLSRSEITAIRAYFSRHVDRHVMTQTQQQQQQQQSTTTTTAVVPSDEPDLQRRRWLQEEEWMSLQGPSSEFRLNLNSNTVLRFPSVGGGGGGVDGSGGSGSGSGLLRSSVGTDRDFLWGFLLGFFVGFVMLVWVWMPTVPHKQKLGILTGISFQLALNVLRQQEDDEDLVDEE
jgi:hypothetical protein